MAESMIETMQDRVLIVDDDPNLIRAAHLRLTVGGYLTESASNGREAMERVKADPPDAILLDVRMPRKDGLTVLAELQADPAMKQIPVVMVSASICDQERALKAGARYFLTKPYDGKVLLATINAVRDEQKAKEQ